MRVSVIIPVYRAEAFLRDTVASALALPEVAEVVLAEDGSPDGSLAVCEALVKEHAKVRLVRHPGGVNKGAAATRNLGLRAAREEFVAFLDADDRFLPDRFAAEHAVWAAHPDADGVYGATGVLYHDAEGRARFEQQFAKDLTTVRVGLPPERLFGAFLGMGGEVDFGHFCLDALTLRRSALERMPGWFREDVNIGEDTDFRLRASAHLRLYPGSIDRAVCVRGVHAGNRVTNDPNWHRSLMLMYAALIEWARREPAGRPGLQRLGEEFAAHALKGASTPGERRRALGAFLRYHGSMKRLDNWHAAIGLALRRAPWLAAPLQAMARAAFRCIWWLRGGAPPEVRASWEAANSA